MKLAVVILNWNAAEDTVSCLRSVQTWKGAGLLGRPTLWVVDNGSRPPGIEPIRREFPEVRVLASPVNRGFAGGSNLGIAAALADGCDAVLLLNNDAVVEASGVAAMLATLASDPGIGVVGPTLWHHGRCISAGGRDIARHRVTHLRLREPPATRLDVDYVPGTVALVRRQLFEAVGLLDEDYFFGGEMADLCRRARLHGLRSVTDPAARAVHDLDRSSRERRTLHVYYIVRNRFLFVRKHYPRQRAWLYAVWTGWAALAALAALGHGDTRRARAVALAVLDAARGRFGGQNERVLG
jgi:GT2 family glycosyltransferase